MRDSYFKLYQKLVYNKFYYGFFGSSASLINFLINIVTCFASGTGIYAWYVWKIYPWAWATVLGVSQVINATKGYFPFSKRISIIQYYTQEMECLINKVDNDWRKIECGSYDLSEKEINNLIENYQFQFTEIDHRYIEVGLFRDRDRYRQKATKYRDKYFENEYGTPSYNELIRGRK